MCRLLIVLSPILLSSVGSSGLRWWAEGGEGWDVGQRVQGGFRSPRGAGAPWRYPRGSKQGPVWTLVTVLSPCCDDRTVLKVPAPLSHLHIHPHVALMSWRDVSLRWKNWWVRGILTLAMIFFFFFIVYLGPIVLMVIVSTHFSTSKGLLWFCSACAAVVKIELSCRIYAVQL